MTGYRTTRILVSCTTFTDDTDPDEIRDSVFNILSAFAYPGENFPAHTSIDGAEVVHQ